MSTLKRGDTVMLKFPLGGTWRKLLLVEQTPYLDNKVDVIYFDTQERICRDRLHIDLVEKVGGDL